MVSVDELVAIATGHEVDRYDEARRRRDVPKRLRTLKPRVLGRAMTDPVRTLGHPARGRCRSAR